MKENNTNQNEIPEKDLTDGKLFADAILNAEGELYTTLYKHFADEMQKASKGRICTPERMAVLYPIFREINIEQDEIKREWAIEERKYAKQQERKKKKNPIN